MYSFLTFQIFSNNKLFLQKQQNWNWNQLKILKPNLSYFSWCSTAAAIMRLMAWICTKWMSFNIQCKQMSNPFPHWDCMYEERTHRVWSRPTFYRSSLLKTWGKTYTKGSFSIETRFTQWQDMAGWRVEVLRDHAITLNRMLNSSEPNVFSLWVSFFYIKS